MTKSGDDVAAAFPVTAWETAHGDLYYANFLSPLLGVLDWELWGRDARRRRGPQLVRAARL